MDIIPSIDLLDGSCVRLFRGRYDESTVYPENPVATARRFEEEGARWIHVVDLNAAGERGGTNRSIIASICRSVSCSVEVGGGIRSEDDVNELLEIGVARLIVGTILIKEPEAVSRWVKRHGAVFVGGLDARNGMLQVRGWEDSGGVKDSELAARLEDLGLVGVIYTNIVRDGTLSGPDIDSTNAIAEASGLPVVLSGGIGSEEDIRAVWRQGHPGVKGVITGKAVYEKKIRLGVLINEVQTDTSDGW